MVSKESNGLGTLGPRGCVWPSRASSLLLSAPRTALCELSPGVGSRPAWGLSPFRRRGHSGARAAHCARGRVPAGPRCPPHPSWVRCPQAQSNARAGRPGPRALGGLRRARDKVRAGHAGSPSDNRSRRHCHCHRPPPGESR
jgi:hypothetical protein